MHRARLFVLLKRLPALPSLTLAVLAMLMVLTTATTVSAQVGPEPGGKVFGLVGGSFGDGETAVATSGGAGIRLTRHLGLDVELFHVAGLDLSEDNFFALPLTFAPPLDIEREGGLTAFLTKFNVDFPVGARLIPFVAGGGGIGRLSEEISFENGRRDAIASRERLGQLFGDRRPLIFPPADITFSETGLVLTLEGGLDVLLWKGFSIGGDARWVRLLADRGTFDFAQITSRVSYRF